jgi:hypothetical protein
MLCGPLVRAFVGGHYWTIIPAFVVAAILASVVAFNVTSARLRPTVTGVLVGNGLPLLFTVSTDDVLTFSLTIFLFLVVGTLGAVAGFTYERKTKYPTGSTSPDPD